MPIRKRSRLVGEVADPLDVCLRDARGAERVVRFFERVLRHPKPPFAGRAFILQPWQVEEIIRPIFDPVDERGARMIRKALLMMAKKNGKSGLAAGLALFLLFADGEWSGEIASAAGDREQASIVYHLAADMVDFSPILKDRAIVRRAVKKIVDKKTRSTYHAISAEAGTKHGPSWNGIIFDELHTQPDRDLWDALTTGTRGRRQPLTLAISTAGWDRHSICWEVADYARRVQAGLIPDPTFYSRIWEVPEGADWQDERAWYLANPGLGTTDEIAAEKAFLDVQALRDDFRHARATPAYQNTFRRLSLNQWTSQESRWLDMAKWRSCGDPIDVDGLAGRTTYGGLDLSSTTDLSAFVLAFPDDDNGVTLLAFFWCPAESIEKRSKKDGVPCQQWAKAGLIEPTPGNVVDYSFIRARINDLASEYDIRAINYDPWNATQLSTELEGDGLTLHPIRQGFAALSPAAKELERLVTAGLLRHGGNPILEWMAENVMVIQDASGNLKPDKARSKDRIDGISAAVNALDLVTRHVRRPTEPSITWI